MAARSKQPDLSSRIQKVIQLVRQTEKAFKVGVVAIRGSITMADLATSRRLSFVSLIS